MDLEVAMSAAAPKRDSTAGAGTQSETAARFPRSLRLLRHADFERVYKLGRRHFSASMTVFYLQRSAPGAEGLENIKARGSDPKKAKNGSAGYRVGFTVGRALGGAVQRNRMKRRLREAVRLSRPLGSIAADVVINPKKSLLTAEFAGIAKEVSRAFVVIEQKLSAKSETAASEKRRQPDTLRQKSE
jgi:ribonuclease P protein component